MTRLFTLLALSFLFVASATAAVAVSGTSVMLDPPPGHVASTRFAGFVNEETGASIMVTEMPAPFDQLVKGFTRAQALQEQGMTLLEQAPIRIDGQEALLLHVEQTAHGLPYRKWIALVARPQGTTLLVGAFKKTDAGASHAIRQALLGARFPAKPVAHKAASWHIQPAPPFAIGKTLGNTVIFTPDGQFPMPAKADTPFFVAGLSLSQAPDIPDQKVFAQRRIQQTASFRDIAITDTTATTINGLRGFAITASATASKTGTPFVIYQVVLFEADGYVLMQGLAPAKERQKYLPVFQRMAQSFTKPPA